MNNWFCLQPKCDRCGRFHKGGKGSSWVHVPAIEIPGHTFGDERTRCASCTNKYGPARARGDYVRHLVEGVVS